VMIEVLEEIAVEIDDLDLDVSTLDDSIDTLNDDLEFLEDIVYDEAKGEPIPSQTLLDCAPTQEMTESFDEETDETVSFFAADCPHCGAELELDEDLIALGTITCPSCGQTLELELDEDE